MNTMMRILLMGAMVSGSVAAMDESLKKQQSPKVYIGVGKLSPKVSVAVKADIRNAYLEPVVYPAPQKFVPDEEEIVSQQSSERSSPALSNDSANSDSNSDTDDEEELVFQPDTDPVVPFQKTKQLFHETYLTKPKPMKTDEPAFFSFDEEPPRKSKAGSPSLELMQQTAFRAYIKARKKNGFGGNS